VRFRPRFTVDRTAVRTLLSFGLAVVGVQALSVLSSNADYLAVGRILGPEDLGQYTIAYRLPELLIDNVYWIFSSVALPWYSRARTRSADSFKDTMLRALTMLTLFGFPMGTALALVARDAVPVLFSEQWRPAIGPMILLALSAGMGPSASPPVTSSRPSAAPACCCGWTWWWPPSRSPPTSCWRATASWRWPR
jgi:lipopolysaccharide exporter